MGKHKRLNEKFLTDLQEVILQNNIILVKKFESEGSQLNSIESLKISFSNKLLEDIELLDTLSGNNIFKIRHADLIIRNMFEQVIEFKYMIENPDATNEFLGDNINLKEIEANDDPVDALLEFGQRRYSTHHKYISLMAQKITQNDTSGDGLPLYELYRILSEQCHNSYYMSEMDDIEECETMEETIALTNNHINFIKVIICCFLESYAPECV
jgi:hypothetical protein